MENKIFELVKYIANTFVDNDKLVFEFVERENENVIIIKAGSEDIGKIIGKQGKIATAIRTIVRSMPKTDKKKYLVEIKDL